MYEGPDRVEFSELLGRPIRQGTFQELSISDRQRVEQSLQAKDLAGLTQYWGYLQAGHQIMTALAVEWALRWKQEIGVAGFERASTALEQTWSEAESALGTTILEFLRGCSGLEFSLEGQLDEAVSVLEPASQGDWEGARQAFEKAFAKARIWHDILFRFSWAAMSVIHQDQGQAEAEATIRRVLTSTAFYEPSWQQTASLNSRQLAVFLAEHLRLHFSGPDGAGVEIREENGHIRLKLAPCGSGGAMRRVVGSHPGFARFSEASAMTWGRTDVPAYCSHCALNEIESKKRLGEVRWVTEFHPDDERACGWSIPLDRPVS